MKTTLKITYLQFHLNLPIYVSKISFKSPRGQWEEISIMLLKLMLDTTKVSSAISQPTSITENILLLPREQLFTAWIPYTSAPTFNNCSQWQKHTIWIILLLRYFCQRIHMHYVVCVSTAQPFILSYQFRILQISKPVFGWWTMIFISLVIFCSCVSLLPRDENIFNGHYLKINSLWPKDNIWHHRMWSTLVQVMACCQMAKKNITWTNAD